MLSSKPIRLIESHEEELAASVLRSIRHHPDLPHLGKLPDWELRERGRDILRNLDHFLRRRDEDQLAQEYENLGKLRFEQGVPLDESMRAFLLLKQKMIEHIDEQGTDQDYLALYAEEQFERRIGQFFDFLTIHLARGYERAWRHTAHAG